MILDLSAPVRDARDLSLLHELLSPLIGQPFHKVEADYGGEMTLHLGEPQPYRLPRLADERKGSWIVGTRGSDWQLLLRNPPALVTPRRGTENGDLAAAEQFVNPRLSGQFVTSVDVAAPSEPEANRRIWLTIGFGDGSTFSVLPTAGHDGDPPVADWELFTPFGMYLTCGPGASWSYLPSGRNEAAP